jgi:hypothetical protein
MLSFMNNMCTQYPIALIFNNIYLAIRVKLNYLKFYKSSCTSFKKQNASNMAYQQKRLV